MGRHKKNIEPIQTQEPQAKPVEPVAVPVLVIKSNSPASKYVKELLERKFNLNLGDDVSIYGNEPYAQAVIEKYACRAGNQKDSETARELMKRINNKTF